MSFVYKKILPKVLSVRGNLNLKDLYSTFKLFIQKNLYLIIVLNYKLTSEVNAIGSSARIKVLSWVTTEWVVILVLVLGLVVLGLVVLVWLGGVRLVRELGLLVVDLALRSILIELLRRLIEETSLLGVKRLLGLILLLVLRLLVLGLLVLGLLVSLLLVSGLGLRLEAGLEAGLRLGGLLVLSG